MGWRYFTDWRRFLIYTHRWLGIAGCLVFIVWFVSGVAMMYWRMPSLTAEERLWRMEALDLSAVGISPGEAASAAGLDPTRLRVAMLDGRPVYRFVSDGLWTTVYADNGEVFGGWSDSDALHHVARNVPEHASTLRHEGTVDAEYPDQWTLQSVIRNQAPLHRIALGDPDGTDVYVSNRTGETAVKTTASGRFWGYWSGVLHWTYFPFLRRHSEFWNGLIIWSAGIGGFICLTGLAVGVWRLALRKRYRLKGVPAHSPYSGYMKWHHYAGLLFGVVTFTWAISGMLSLSPFAALGSKPAEDTLVHAPAGGSFDISLVGSPQVRDGARAIEAEFPPKELEYVQFRGAPYFLAYRPPEAHDPEGWTDTDIAAYLSENLNRDHVLVSAKLPENGLFSRFPDHAMADVARQAMPGVAIRDEVWLEEYDAYYYDRSGANPLPVLRVRFEDPDETWLYLNPQHGTIIRRNQKASRLNRWLYQGLHSLDFPFMYYSRPLWDIVVIALSIGGLALSATTLVPALRRLGRRSRELGRRVFS